MNKHDIGIDQWLASYRKMMNFYWLITLLSIAVQVIGFIIMNRTSNFFWKFVVLNASLLLLVMLLGELLLYFKPHLRDWLLGILGTMFASITLYLNASNGMAIVAYLLPFAINIFSFNARLIWANGLLCLGSYLTLYMVSPRLQDAAHSTYLLGHLMFLIGSTISTYAASRWIYGLIMALKAAEQAKYDIMAEKVLMEKASKTDLLTQLNNHKTFHEYLDNMIEHCERHRFHLQLVLLDIDNFKLLNDSYGHWVGDLVLKRTAQLISKAITSDDFAARYGGEEFAILCTNKTDEAVYHLAEDIRMKIERQKHQEVDRHVTISIGIEAYRCGMGKEEFFKKADLNLYTAKRHGKNRTVFMDFSA